MTIRAINIVTAMSKWISIDEMIPAEGVDVLCWYTFNPNCEYRICSLRADWADGYYVWIDSARGHEIRMYNGYIKLWMPLPKLPKDKK